MVRRTGSGARPYRFRRVRVVTRNDERARYELVEDGQVIGICDFRPAGTGVVVLPHTVIHGARRGRGLGAELVRAALDDLRTTGVTVVPSCWYVAEFIERHPEYAAMLATA